MMRFIDENRSVYGVEPICKQLPIAPSTYHQHAARQSDPAKRLARAQRDDVLCARIQQAWEENFKVYGVRKLLREPRRQQVDDRHSIPQLLHGEERRVYGDNAYHHQM